MDAKAYNHDGERDFTEKEIIALCVACTLGDAMQTCFAGCPLSVGYAVRRIHEQSLALDAVGREILWSTLSEGLWQAYYQYAFADADIKQTREHFVKLEKFSLAEERKAEAMAGCNR